MEGLTDLLIKNNFYFMKRKKVIVKERNSDLTIYENGRDSDIVKDIDGNLFFKVGKEITNDLAEGVILLMRNKRTLNDSDIWSIIINKQSGYNINPEKSLFWLTGGTNEWKTRANYKKSWGESYSLFISQYGEVISDIVNKSRTLGDIKKSFLKELNILELYEFALSNRIA